MVLALVELPGIALSCNEADAERYTSTRNPWMRNPELIDWTARDRALKWRKIPQVSKVRES